MNIKKYIINSMIDLPSLNILIMCFKYITYIIKSCKILKKCTNILSKGKSIIED